MAETEAPQPELLIINRRLHDEEEEHHGGVWKIALADFMTALMAFFLVMWLINATDEEAKEAIATYFNPIVLAEDRTDKKGLQEAEDADGPDGEHDGEPGFEHRTSTPPDSAGRAAAADAARQIAALERAAYQDPYAILAEIARHVDPRLPTRPDVQENEPGIAGETGGDSARDPFDPVYWQTVIARPDRTLRPGEPGTVGPAPEDRPLDAAAPLPRGGDPGAAGAPRATEATGAGGAAPRPAGAEGGEAAEDLTALADRVAEALATDGIANLEVSVTPEGVLISLTDDADFSMFPIGSAVPRPGLLALMEEIADVLSGHEGAVIVRGHTDGRPFRSETYDNWRLSTSRAHMAQYMLVRGGLAEDRIASVEGFADTRLRDPSDPYAAVNRRIEILLKPTAAASEGASSAGGRP